MTRMCAGHGAKAAGEGGEAGDVTQAALLRPGLWGVCHGREHSKFCAQAGAGAGNGQEKL